MGKTKRILELLETRSREVMVPLPVTWCYPKRAPAKPLQVRPARAWRILERGDQEKWKKNGENWFYADLTFPQSRCGIRLTGEEALCFVEGWQPFTLWIDGQEIWKESHIWKATGPIADPFPVRIDPARQHRLVMCITPTELPDNSISLSLRIIPRPCLDIHVGLSAAVAQLRLVQDLARHEREEKLVDEAAACIDVNALKSLQWPAVMRSLEKMEQALSPLSARAKELTVHLIGHSHIDMDWLWTWEDTVHCVRRDFKAVTNLMDDYPELTFTHSQVPTYEIIRRQDPDMFRKVCARIAEGRWENAAGTWIEGDLNMADGESIARHMLYATDWTRHCLASKAKVLWEPDTFGHPGNLPQLARLGEFDCYFHMRCHPHKGYPTGLLSNDADPDQPCPMRIWTGIDGTHIPAFSISYNGNLMPMTVVDRARRHLRQGLRNALHVWGIGDHGGALARLEIEILESYREKPLIPNIRFSTMRELLTAVQGEKVKLPGNKGETYSLFEGCFTTRASIKKYNRLCESTLLSAETLTALAGLDRRKAVRDAWTPTLFNHFHDIMDGSAVHDSYINAHKRARTSLRRARRIINETAAILVQRIPRTKPVKDGMALTLLNPLGFNRTEPVRVSLPKGTICLEDADGNVVPVQKFFGDHIFIAKDIPAFSRKTYRIHRKAPCSLDTAPVRVSEDKPYYFYIVKTNTAVARISRSSGTIGSYFDKALKKELVAYGVPIPLTHVPTTHADMALNVFQIIDESPTGMSAWLIHDVLKQENLMRAAKVRLVETGPVFARFRVEHTFRSSQIEEDILFYRDFNRVDFETQIDWREKGSDKAGTPQLKVSFAAGMKAARVRTEGPFVVREIAADGMEMPTQKWADLCGDEFGFILLNDSKYGMDALGGRLRITLLRNPYGPDPDPDSGTHVIRFAFQPHGRTMSNGELVRAGMAYNRPPVPVLTNQARPDPLPYMVIEGSRDIVCTSLRAAEYSDRLLLRFFETSGRRCRVKVTFGKGIRSAKEVNFLENPIGSKVRSVGGKIALAFRPFEVKTLLLKGKIFWC